jgi:SET domain-containing protein
MTRIGIFAIKNIPKGTELSYDYQVTHLAALSSFHHLACLSVDLTPLCLPSQLFSSERTPCACHTKKCRGFLSANLAKDQVGHRRCRC